MAGRAGVRRLRQGRHGAGGADPGRLPGTLGGAPAHKEPDPARAAGAGGGRAGLRGPAARRTADPGAVVDAAGAAERARRTPGAVAVVAVRDPGHGVLPGARRTSRMAARADRVPRPEGGTRT